MMRALPKPVWPEWLAQKVSPGDLIKRLDTISADPLLLALWWMLERLCSQGDARNVNFYWISLRWSIYHVNTVDEPISVFHYTERRRKFKNLFHLKSYAFNGGYQREEAKRQNEKKGNKQYWKK